MDHIKASVTSGLLAGFDVDCRFVLGFVNVGGIATARLHDYDKNELIATLPAVKGAFMLFEHPYEVGPSGKILATPFSANRLAVIYST